MAASIDFYFDYSSPYGYIASQKIDEIAARHERTVAWRPYLLGAAFQTTGMKPPDQQPLRGVYAMRDFPRAARFHGVEFCTPDTFPIAGIAPSRAFYAVVDRDPELAKRLAKALYRAYFVDNRDISKPETTADVAAEQGLARDEMLAALQDQAVKDRLKQETGTAIERGVFGSPFIIVDGEPFWGSDRLDMVDEWLESGGW